MSTGAQRAHFFGLTISPIRLVAFTIYCFLLAALLPIAANRIADPGFLPGLYLAFMLGAIVPGVLTFRTGFDLIEPINWFSLMYWLVFPGALYFLMEGFSASEHIQPMTEPRLERAVTVTMAMFVIGYLSFVLGYVAIVRDEQPAPLRLPTLGEFSPLIARAGIAACVAAGAINFLYLLVSYPRGILGYMLDFGIRAHRYDVIGGGATTIGYQFLYAGVNLWFMVLIRENRLRARFMEAWLFIATAALSIGISISEGRMSQTVTYVLGLGFLVYVTSAGQARNLRYVALVATGMVLGIGLYLLRRASTAAYTGTENFVGAGLGPYAQRFVGDLGYWIIGKGNVPNVPIVVNLVDQGGIGGEFLHGESFFTWVTGFSSLLGDTPNIGQRLGLAWQGMSGGLPPTIIGEMYVNFGFMGVPLGLCAAGIASAWFYRTVRSRGEYLWYVVYLAVLLKFLFLWPKGEFANLVVATWAFLPTVMIYGAVRALSGGSAREVSR
jgi:hypothetical protein